MNLSLDAVGAVLFDMDGTLIDSHPAVERAWRAVAARQGLDADAVLAVCHGVPAEVTLRLLLPDAPAEVVADEVARHLEQECTDLDGVVALPGALDLIAHLDAVGAAWAVVTSATARLARARLGAAGITAPVLVSYEDVAAGKPAPDGFLEGARRCGVGIETCLAVEDSAPGLAAARASGATVINVGPCGTSLITLLGALRG